VRDGMLGMLVDPREPQQLIDAILASIDKPKQVPGGMDYFTFAQFAERIRGGTRPLLKR